MNCKQVFVVVDEVLLKSGRLREVRNAALYPQAWAQNWNLAENCRLRAGNWFVMMPTGACQNQRRAWHRCRRCRCN